MRMVVVMRGKRNKLSAAYRRTVEPPNLDGQGSTPWQRV